MEILLEQITGRPYLALYDFLSVDDLVWSAYELAWEQEAETEIDIQYIYSLLSTRLKGFALEVDHPSKFRNCLITADYYPILDKILV